MKILAAEISPSVKVAIQQNNIFEEPSVISCDHIVAIARPYALGSDVTRFEVQIGVLDGEKFTRHYTTQAELTKEELANWGVEDEVCLTEIAKKIGATALSFKEVDSQGF